MKITLTFDVAHENGRNYPQERVAEELAEQLEGELRTNGGFFMEDQADTHYVVDSVTPT